MFGFFGKKKKQYSCPVCPVGCGQCGAPASAPGTCHCGAALMEKSSTPSK